MSIEERELHAMGGICVLILPDAYGWFWTIRKMEIGG